MPSFSLFAAVVMTAIILILVVYIAYLKWRQRPFTRDRFAFAALWANAGAAMFVLTTLMEPMPPWVLVANLINQVAGRPVQVPVATDPINSVLAVLVFAFLLYWSNQTFRHWNGSVSARQNDLEAAGDGSDLFWEGLTETQRLLRRLPAPPVCDKSLTQKPTFGRAA